jgi:hypothetical protein
MMVHEAREIDLGNSPSRNDPIVFGAADERAMTAFWMFLTLPLPKA